MVSVGTVVVVVMGVWVLLWADVLHLVDGTALWASLNWAFTGSLVG
jgi:hypothetical protein